MTPVTERVEAQQQMLGDPQHLRSPQMDGDSFEPVGFRDQRLKTLSKKQPNSPGNAHIIHWYPNSRGHQPLSKHRQPSGLEAAPPYPLHTCGCDRFARNAKRGGEVFGCCFYKVLIDLGALEGNGSARPVACDGLHLDWFWVDFRIWNSFNSQKSTVKRLFERI